MGKLEGRVAIITGAGGGLGSYIALRLAEEGAILMLTDFNSKSLKETAARCEHAGFSVTAKTADLSDPKQIKSLVQDTIGEFHTIDILVNLAIAIRTPHSFLEHELDTLDESYRTGLVSTWLMMKESYPYLKQGGGKIINFGSGAGYYGLEGYAAYAAIKEGIRALSRVVAREWGKDNINVNVINPGALTDGIHAHLDSLPEDQRDPQLLGFMPTAIGRYGEAYKDIAPVVAFLASEDARHITGQTFFVDGGAIINA
ncbi:SDR family NAD(P)-dependent oxidoreductase [Paenibacillus taichungensis]|uniref:SDR family NAD(P)-dependent oxidoreductase n=1 Tax=Paenibacillus taichungensis TaxID=484184 RepID=UPI003D9A5036